ncbi:MAG: SSU ribosomal protein S14p (S29e) @ SSU ribosomal protein S14p (S29e), zinc-dependent, partial [uncultured Gemmatimonadetes bacterium]
GTQGPDRKDQPQAQVRRAWLQPLQPLRPPPRLSAQVRTVPHLLPRAGAARRDPRRAQGQLV